MSQGIRFAIWFVVIIAAIGLGFVSCTRSTNDLRFATVESDWFNAPFTLALEEMEQEREPNPVRIDFSSGLASKTAVLAGDADIGLAALPPLLRDPKARDEIVILACYMKSDAVIGLATTDPDAPLEGTVGVVEGSISEIFLSEFAAPLGQKVSDLNTLGIRPPDAVTLLRNGSIQTASIWESHLSRAAAIDGVSILRPREVYEISVCAIANRETADARKDDVEVFLAALSGAGASLMSSPTETRERVQDVIPGDYIIPGDVWDYVDFSIVTDPEIIKSRLDTEVVILTRAGLLSESIDYSHLLSFVDAR